VTTAKNTSSYWETNPRVLATSAEHSAFGEEQLFKLACRASARRSELLDPQDVRLFVDENIVNPTQVQDWLPTLDRERSFAAYADRMTADAGSFALTINSLQQFGWDFWRALRRQVDPILTATERWSAGGVDCHLIASVYGTAPTLIHKDTAGVFTHVVSGFKRYFTWPFDTFDDIAGDGALQRQVNLPAAVRVQDYQDTATVVEGGPGAVLYWPSDRWHCATSDGRYAVSLHIAHYQWDDRLSAMLAQLRKAAAADLALDRFASGPGFDSVGSEAVDAGVITALARIVADGGLSRHATLARLKRVTASNFEVVPPLRTVANLARDHVLTVPDVSAARTLSADGMTYLAVNGHLARVAGGDWIDTFLPALRARATRTVTGWIDAVRSSGGPSEDGEAAMFLRELVKRGALDVAEAAG